MGGYTSDFSAMYEMNGIEYLLINFEFKNELSTGRAEANFGYLIHFQSMNRSHAPAFLVTVVGCHYLQVFGAIWHNASVCVDPLMEPISLLAVPHDPLKGTASLARVFASLEKAHDNLVKYYTSLSPVPPQSSVPYFKSFEE